jgi:thiamine-phosphate pyrophosphorylase
MPKPRLNNRSLYLVISQEYSPEKEVLEIARQAIAGGVDILQMREKNLSQEELIRLGKRLAELCRNKDVAFIVNDNPFLVKEVEADGVHMGQEDIAAIPVSKARKIIGPDKVIGVSTHSLAEFNKANEEDVDYIAFGPVFPTQTKDYFIGTRDVVEVLKTAKKDVFFIGGINLSNIEMLLDLGVKKIALIRGIMQADDVVTEAKNFKQKLLSISQEVFKR